MLSMGESEASDENPAVCACMVYVGLHHVTADWQILERTSMSNYRIYFKGTQNSPHPCEVYPSKLEAQAGIMDMELENFEWIDKLEARPDLDPITVSHGLPEGEKE
jgi:hypothetical protein